MEKKTNVIPLVVASEEGRGQTKIYFGVVGHQCGLSEDSRSCWKATQYKVIALYTKSSLYLGGS